MSGILKNIAFGKLRLYPSVGGWEKPTIAVIPKGCLFCLNPGVMFTNISHHNYIPGRETESTWYVGPLIGLL
jgi:hypothetical protein